MTTGADFTVHHSLAPILDTVLDAVVVMSTDGEICGWNGVAERVFGGEGLKALVESSPEMSEKVPRVWHAIVEQADTLAVRRMDAFCRWLA